MAATLALCTFAGAAGAATLVPAGNLAIQYMGHWDKKPTVATTTNSGSSILFGFTGQHLGGSFVPSNLAAAHRCAIYVSIDGGLPVMYVLDTTTEVNFTPTPLAAGNHTVELVVKDVDEHNNRWTLPLLSSVGFNGFIIDDGEFAQTGTSKWLHWSPGARTMEFYGDSITQGVLAAGRPGEPAQGTDGTRDYAHLTGLAFDAYFNQIGYGAQGITRGGGGNVPAANAAFGFNFSGSPADSAFIPEVVVINQGTNDGGSPSATFTPAYQTYLQTIRARYPGTWIFAMRPFNGAHAADISNAVTTLADPRIVYVDTTGWLTAGATNFTDGLHPNETGHGRAARFLIPIIASTAYGITPPSVPARVVPNLLDLRTGIPGLVTVVLTVPSGMTVVDVRGNGARALSGAVSPDGVTYVATFQKSDLTNVPPGTAPAYTDLIDFNITGTLRGPDRNTLPFATAVPVRIIK